MTGDAPAAFVSYCRVDSDFALRLASDLKAAGASVWLDKLDIVPGQRWDRAVEDALANCPYMLVILSPESVESTNVMDEVSFALDEKKTVVPVVYRDCAIPFRLRRLQYVDCRQNYDRGLEELLKTLGSGQNSGQSARAVLDVPSRRLADATEAEKPERPLGPQRRETALAEEALVKSQAERKTQRDVPESETRQRAKAKLRLTTAGSVVVALIGIFISYSFLRHSSLLTLTGHSASVNSVAGSPDGKRLATGSDDEHSRMLMTLTGHSDSVDSVAWSPDGKRLATGSMDKTAKVWNAETGAELRTLSGNEGVLDIAWSPDGKLLAMTGPGNAATVWDARR